MEERNYFVPPSWCGCGEVHENPKLCWSLVEGFSKLEDCAACEYCCDYATVKQYLRRCDDEFSQFVEDVKGNVDPDILREMRRQYHLIYFRALNMAEKLDNISKQG